MGGGTQPFGTRHPTITHVLTGFRRKTSDEWQTWYKLCSLHTGGLNT